MNEDLILECSRLIAEFDGLIEKPADSKFNIPQFWKPDSNDGRKKGSFIGYVHQLEYHLSFDWIMLVFFKFRDLVITNEVLFIQHEYWIKKIVEALKYGDVSDNPSKAFIKIVEAIKWHNENVQLSEPKVEEGTKSVAKAKNIA